MISAGELSVDLTCSGGRVTVVRLASTRRTDFSRVLEGKPVDEALSLVPLLFSLCGRAQAIAAVTAAEHALDLGADHETRALRRWLIVAEQTQEYLWRLLVDLPAANGETTAVSNLTELRDCIAKLFKTVQGGRSAHLPGEQLASVADGEFVHLAGLLESCIESQVLGQKIDAWRGIETAAGFLEWLETGNTVVTRALRHVAADTESTAYSAEFLSATAAGPVLAGMIERLLDDAGFAASPAWQGRHPETGALARRRSAPLIAALAAARCDRRLLRSAARLLELVDAIDALRDVPAAELTTDNLGGGSLGAGIGYGWVETARGLLIHAICLEEGRIDTYRILAPTEWNFHPQGPLVQELLALKGRDANDLEQQARLAVLALDPCVGFKVCVHDA